MKNQLTTLTLICAAIVMLTLALTAHAQNTIIRPEDFGAVADGKTDCTDAIRKAIAQANRRGPGATVQFSKGRYILYAGEPKSPSHVQDTSHLEGEDKEQYELYKQVARYQIDPCIRLRGIKGITIAGEGKDTELIVTSPLATTFDIVESEDITIRDLAIDYDPLPFTQGSIVAVDKQEGTFDYRIDDGFSALSQPWFSQCDAKWGFPFDENRRFRMQGESAVFTDSWDRLGERTWRMHLHYPEQAKRLRIGDHFIHLARSGSAAMFSSMSGDIRIHNVHVYACAGAASIFFRCRGDIHVDGLSVRPRPGTDRILSTNSDCVHCQSLRQGPLIENCIFENMADDGTNFYTMPSVINEILANNKVRVDDVQVLRKGDRIQILRASEGRLVADNVAVISVEGPLVTFEKPLPGLKAGQNHVEADAIFNLSACGNGFVVRNNLIGGSRGRGILASAHNGLIEGNTVHHTSGQGIQVYNEPDWPQGPVPANVTIRNNTLISVQRDGGQDGAGAIHVAAMKLRYRTADTSSLRGLVIENNHIIDPPGYAMLVEGVTDATIRKNLVQLTHNSRPVHKYHGIRLNNCRSVTIDHFAMVDQWARVAAAIVLDETPADQVKIDQIPADLSPQGRPIQNQSTTQTTPVVIGIDTAGSYHMVRHDIPLWTEPAFFDAARELGAQFVNLGDSRIWGPGPLTLEHVARSFKDMDEVFRRNNMYYTLNTEMQMFRTDLEIEPGVNEFAQDDGRHLWLLRYEWLEPLAHPASGDRRLLGIVYDEPAHLQLCNNKFSNHPANDFDKPYLVNTHGMSLEQAYDALVAECRRIRHEHYRGLPVISEQIWPDLFHIFARAGWTITPKFLKESFSPVIACIALGAAIQYQQNDTHLWVLSDLWGMSGYPGHSPEELRSALLMSYWLGAEGIYVENVDWPGPMENENEVGPRGMHPEAEPGGSLIRWKDPDHYELTKYGEIFQWFTRDYIPANPRTVDWRNYKPRVAIIRLPDGAWGQFPASEATGGNEAPSRNRLLGNREMPIDEIASEWLKAWSILTHGVTRPGAINYNNALVYPQNLDFFVPVDSVAVFDHEVTGPILDDVECFIVCGHALSKQTFNAVKQRVQSGATCIIAKRLYEMYRDKQDTPGDWLLVEDFTDPALARKLKPFLGPENIARYRFTDRTVDFIKGSKPHSIEVRVRKTE